MEKKHISKCSCSWFGEAEGGTKIVNYFCPQCRTGKYLVSVGNYYRAADVDAMLADVRRLVDEAKLLIESAEDSHSHCDCYEVATLLKCSRDTEKAIAAVEAIISPPRSSPPPEGNGKA